MNWKIKAVVQKVLSVTPGGGWANDRLQVLTGELKDFDRNIATKVGDWCDIMSYLGAVGATIEGKALFEIGTGWYPTLPVCFSLAGARTVHTVDINRHLNAEMTFRMVRGLERHLDRIAERSSHRVYERYTRLATAQGIDDLLGRADIVYSAPLDATRLSGIPDHSLDIVFSNSVMEHIPAPVIGSLMRESHRVLKDDGLAVHAVGCNDHYAFFDRSISFINFLRYSEREWAVWNNTLASQNRLRAPDFLQLARGAGFAIVHEHRAVRPGTREALQQMTIAPEFHRYDPEDLVATSVDFVARKTR